MVRSNRFVPARAGDRGVSSARHHVRRSLLIGSIAMTTAGLLLGMSPVSASARPSRSTSSATHELSAKAGAPVRYSPHGRAALTKHGDFNGDGIADSAVGVALKDVNGKADAGAVSIQYGSAAGGLTATGSQLIGQDSPGSVHPGEAGAQFGRYMRGGDFNGDGYYDLVAGVPLQTVDGPNGPIDKAGAFQVFYGSSKGITSNGNQWWTQLGLNSADTAEEGDWLGSRSEGADFNGDGYDDVAVSAMFEDDTRPGGGTVVNAGGVDVLYGSPSGLTSDGAQFFWQESFPGQEGKAHTGDLFGRAMGSGDFNADGYMDLAIGIPHEDVDGKADCGAVLIAYGSAAGLTTDGYQLWTQDSTGIVDGPCDGQEWLGRTGVTGGDFNNDGYDDMAAGAFQDEVDGHPKAGSVMVLYGSAAGLTTTGNQAFTEDTAGSVSDGAEYGDRFGRSVRAGDFNCDGYQDLSSGLSNERVGDVVEAGAMIVLYGGPAGLSEDGNQWWTEDNIPVTDGSEARDSMAGRTPDIGDLNGDGCDDLAIGIFKEDLEGTPTVTDAGAMVVLYGSPGVGLTTTGSQFWNLDSPGVKGVAANGDGYGQDNVG